MVSNKPLEKGLQFVSFDLPMQEVDIIWTIQNFRTLYEIGKVSETAEDKGFAKLDFTAGESIGVPSTWQLYLLQGGEEDIGIFLRITDANLVVLAKFKAEIKTKAGGFTQLAEQPIAYFGNSRVKTGANFAWGSAETKSYSDFTSEILPDDSVADVVVIRLKVTLYGNPFSKGTVNTPEVSKVVLPTDEWKQLMSNSLAMDFKKALETGEGSDMTVTVKAENDLKIPSHKFVLTLRSPVFAKMFQSGMLEEQNNDVVIKDMSVKAVQIMLNWMYTGNIDPEWGLVAEELIYASDLYELVEFQKFVCENIASVLTTTNVLKIRNLSQLYNIPSAVEATTSFIEENVAEFLNCHDVTFKVDLETEET